MESDSSSEYVIVGRVGSSFGVKGWVKVFSFADNANTLMDYSPWFIENNTGWRNIKVEGMREHGKGLIVKFAECHAPEETNVLNGKKIAVLRSTLPSLKKNEYYWTDLTGLTVIDQHGATLGQVMYLIATGSNDVLVVKGEKEHAIPFLLEDVVTRVDLDKKEIHVNWEVI